MTDFSPQYSANRFCLAPMMNRTDRPMRAFFRMISRHALLYTEMIHANAITHGERYDLLKHDSCEYPLACQLGGSDAKSMGEAAKIAASHGFCEVNMNVGCPSDRVQDGNFGACLMKESELVSDCLKSMQEAEAEITMKCRIGVDDYDSYEFLADFIDEVTAKSSVSTVIIHARIAMLQGLSPKENREIPPLKYDRVYKLAKDFPHLKVIINGGIDTIDSATEHLKFCDGVMIGRAAVDKPFLFADCDKRIFGDDSRSVKSRADVFGEYLNYCEKNWSSDIPLFALLRPISGLFYGIGGAKIWRQKLASLPSQSGEVENLQVLYDMQKNFDSYASQRF